MTGGRGHLRAGVAQLPSDTWLPFAHSATLDLREFHPIGTKGRARQAHPLEAHRERLRPRGAGGEIEGLRLPPQTRRAQPDLIRQPRSGGSIEGPATRMRPPACRTLPDPGYDAGETAPQGLVSWMGERGRQCL